jgi:hypothetical protein
MIWMRIGDWGLGTGDAELDSQSPSSNTQDLICSLQLFRRSIACLDVEAHAQAIGRFSP